MSLARMSVDTQIPPPATAPEHAPCEHQGQVDDYTKRGFRWCADCGAIYVNDFPSFGWQLPARTDPGYSASHAALGVLLEALGECWLTARWCAEHGYAIPCPVATARAVWEGAS